MRPTCRFSALAVCAALASLGAGDPEFPPFQADRLLDHIKTLASDEFEGRAPATPGEQKTVDYLTSQFKAMGLKPGNPDGSYVQDVPLVGFKASSVEGAITVGGDKTLKLTSPENWVAVSRGNRERAKVENSEVVFVGYGVIAPEYHWDDYKGFDVRGKTLVMLVNDPPLADPSRFKGPAMTYYGRWTYKYEIASKLGAAAALIVHETKPAGYPFAVVQGWTNENFDIETRGAVPDPRVSVEGWLARDEAALLFKTAGLDLETLKTAAARDDFRPVPLNARADLSVTNAVRSVRSKNVVAKVEGSDPVLKNECVIYTAHWDHLGRDKSLTGDQVFNGAADNASGTAALLEIARAFSGANPPPRRSVVFLAVTAEEKGLLGAKYYAAHPLYPLSKTLLDLNMDVINLWGKTRDVVSLGLGQTTLDPLIASTAAAQDRTVVGDVEPEKGLFYRSDHFEFVKKGIPSVSVRGGVDYRGKPAGYGLAKRDEYTKADYHKVTDEVKPDWDLSVVLDDLRLLTTIGYRVANEPTYPEWLPNTEFREVRRSMLAPKPAARP